MRNLLFTMAMALTLVLGLTNCKEKTPDPESTTTPPAKEDTSSTATPFPETSADTATYFVYSISDDGNVKIRKEPAANAEVIGLLYTNGKGVKLIDGSSSWWKVETGDAIGYVNSKYVTKRHPQADEETADTKLISLKPRPLEEDTTDTMEYQEIEEASNKKDAPKNLTSENKPQASEKAPSAASSSKTSSAQQEPKKNSKKVFYVVVSSWFDFEKAKNSYGKIPDALEGPIYMVKTKGKTVYRMCSSCYRTKEAAQAEVRKIKNYADRDIWIWESDGLADCVYTSVNAKGDKMRPLSPR